MAGPLWEVIGGSSRGGLLVRTGQDILSPQAPDRLSTGALVRELELEGERLCFERLTGSGPNTGWVSLRLAGKEQDLLVPAAGVWEVVGGMERGGVLVRTGQELSSTQASERLSPGALVRQLELSGERLRYERLTGSGPSTGWVSTALHEGRFQLLVRRDRALPLQARHAGPRRVARPKPVLPMGRITSLELAGKRPAFVVVAERVTLHEVPDTKSLELGQLLRGDLAVVEDDLAFFPWLTLPTGSVVRDAEHSAGSTILNQEAYLCAEQGELHKSPTTLALKCEAGSALAHLHLCSCQHWSVVHSLVFVQSEASPTSKRAGLLKQGDFLCPGPSTLRDEQPEDLEWLLIGHDAATWGKSQLRGAPESPLNPGHERGFVLKVDEKIGELVAKVENRAEEGEHAPPPAEVPRPEAPPMEVRLLEAPLRRGPLEVRVAPIPPVKEGGGLRSTQEALREAAEHRGGARAWRVVSEESTGLLATCSLSVAEPLLALELDDVLVRWAEGGVSPLDTWAVLRVGDRVYRRGEVLATVWAENAHALICDTAGRELLQPWSWAVAPADPEAVSVQCITGFGVPWVVAHRQVVVRSEPSTSALPLGLASQDDIVGVQAARDASEWVQLVDNTDVRRRNSGQDNLLPEPAGGGFQQPCLWLLREHETLGTLLRPAGDRAFTLRSPGLLMSPARLGIYSRVVHVCHQRIWADNLQALWEGDASRMLPVEALETKLFNRDVMVFEARRAGEFAGGALVQSFRIRASPEVQVVGGGIQPVDMEEGEGHAIGDVEKVEVGYVDCCATVRGAHVGVALWNAICRQPYCVIALHSIPLPETIDFWEARGMRCLDPDKEDDSVSFFHLVQEQSHGRLHLLLSDLAEALPKHTLPLFVWVNSTLLRNGVLPGLH